MKDGRALRVEIGRITVAGASGLEARRLADSLPGALERALADLASGRAALARPTSPAEQAAARIAAEVGERLKAGR